MRHVEAAITSTHRAWLRFLMIRWRIRGMQAAPSAIICERVRVENPAGVRLERSAQIGAGSHISCVPGTLHLGENAALTEGCWVSAAESVRIEPHALVGPGCHITDAKHRFAGLDLIRDQPRTASPVTIGEGAWLGAGVKVLAGVRVGIGAVVGAGAVVTKDVPDYAVAVGVPARIIGSRLTGEQATGPWIVEGEAVGEQAVEGSGRAEDSEFDRIVRHYER